jgi:hypothetical protein
MSPRGYDTIECNKGKLSRKSSENELPYTRAQYFDFMMSKSESLKQIQNN